MFNQKWDCETVSLREFMDALELTGLPPWVEKPVVAVQIVKKAEQPHPTNPFSDEQLGVRFALFCTHLLLFGRLLFILTSAPWSLYTVSGMASKDSQGNSSAGDAR